MNETSREPVMTWQFLRRHFVQIVIGAVLAVSTYVVISVYVQYQREKRIAKVIESHDGLVNFRYVGPAWIPESVQSRLSFLDRIESVWMDSMHVTDADLEDLSGLTNLAHLGLANTQVTDAGLEHLKGLTNLIDLGLEDTQVTDVGLEHLKG